LPFSLRSFIAYFLSIIIACRGAGERSSGSGGVGVGSGIQEVTDEKDISLSVFSYFLIRVNNADVQQMQQQCEKC